MSRSETDDRCGTLEDSDTGSTGSGHDSPGRLERFVENFGKLPEVDPKPLIPARWRIPVFAAMIVVGTVGLVLFLWLVVMPAISLQSSASSVAPANAPTEGKSAQ